MLACSPCFAQVVSPWEIKDPELSSLQHQYLEELQAAGRDILAIHFDYPFYLSRKLDLDQVAQQRADQHSIRFDNYNGHPVLAITGNYYAAYSTEKMSVDQRARATFLSVVVPILKVRYRAFSRTRMYTVMRSRFPTTSRAKSWVLAWSGPKT